MSDDEVRAGAEDAQEISSQILKLMGKYVATGVSEISLAAGVVLAVRALKDEPATRDVHHMIVKMMKRQ